MSGGEEGEVGDGGSFLTGVSGDSGVAFSTTGPLLAVSPLVTVGVT